MCYFDGHIRTLGTVPERLLAPLDAWLAEHPGTWAAEDRDKPNRFAVFDGAAEHIVFQFPRSLTSHEQSYYRPVWAECREVITPLIAHVVRRYAYTRGRTARIMLARLRVGAAVGRHTDRAAAARVPHKVHVPVVTDPAVSFTEDDTAYHLRRGYAYEVNNRIPHGAENRSPVDRVHLIFDYFDDHATPAAP